MKKRKLTESPQGEIFFFSAADDDYPVRLQTPELVPLLERLSAMADSDELEAWGGVKTMEDMKSEYEEDEIDDILNNEGNVPIPYITVKQVKDAISKLKNADEESSPYEYDDLFLEVWQGLGLR